MKKFTFTIFSLLILFVSAAHATIIETATLKPVKQSLELVDKQTLVIFDVDEVLIVAKDQILLSPYKHQLNVLNKELKAKHNEKEAQVLWSIAFKNRKSELVDPAVISIFNTLRAKDIKTILLTNAWTGPFGTIPLLEDWRIQELKNFGIEVDGSFPNTELIVFTNLTGIASNKVTSSIANSLSKNAQETSRIPVFKKGVLFTAERDKGALLKTFLDKVNWHPNKIIFVDDRAKNLDSVQAYCNSAGIQFCGFHYTAVVDRKVLPLNEQRAKFQFEVLEKEKRWLSDQQADEYMCHHKP